MTFIVSPKQKRIIDLALEGLSNQQIGLRLGNTEGGIEQNMVKIFKIIKEAGYVIKSRAGLKQFEFKMRDRRLRGEAGNDPRISSASY